jgi:N-lysine methyltransferase SETD6
MECGSVNECIHDRQGPPPLVSDYHSSDSEEDEGGDSVQMVTNAVIHPAHEVFNTYGEAISNFELLINYGFKSSI